MATEVEKKAVETTQKNKFQKLMEIAEFRMLVYIIPVAAVILVLALLLGK